MTETIRLLVSDIDGTLVTNDKRLTDGAIAAASRLRDAGIALALTSSRPPHGLEAFAKPLGLETPRGAFNGGILVSADGTILEEKRLSESALRQAIARLEAHDIDIWLFTATEWVVNRPNGHYVPLEHRTVKLEPTVVSDFTPYLGRIGKLMASSQDPALLAAAEHELQQELHGQVAAHLSQTYYLDVTHPDANKGESVQAIARQLGIDLAETACIGDMTNDVPMVSVAGYSIAMGNAPDAVKALATATTLSNEAEGFAHAVDTLLPATRAETLRADMTRKVSLLLADVDGTLVTKEKTLTKQAIAAVHALHERGIGFALTSGRPPKGMQMLIAPLAVTTPVAGFNGGLFVQPDMSIIEARTLPRDVADTAVELIRKAGLDVWVYSGEDWIVHKKDAPHVSREEWTVKFPPVERAEFGSALDHAVKIVGVSDDLELVKQVEKQVQAALGDRASAARSQPYYLDVTHPHANKGDVVLYLANALNISADEIATIGDQPNDVLMFKRGGLSIAMGNAGDDVKAAADEVSTSSEEEGFANAVHRFVLGNC